MFTKEFIKISKVLDEYGLYKQADDLFRIAQTPPTVIPDKDIIGTSRSKSNDKPLIFTKKDFLGFNSGYKSLKQNLDKRITELKNDPDSKTDANSLNTELQAYYKNNQLDYISYKNLLKKLEEKAKELNFTGVNTTPVPPINLTAFPEPTKYDPQFGRGRLRNDSQNPGFVPIQLAKPLEGVSAQGETVFPMIEDDNLPELVKEWNSYYKSPEFIANMEKRIQELKNDDPNADVSKFQELIDKAKSPDGLKVGDFDNPEEVWKPVDPENPNGGSKFVGYDESKRNPVEIYGTNYNPAFKDPNRTLSPKSKFKPSR